MSNIVRLPEVRVRTIEPDKGATELAATKANDPWKDLAARIVEPPFDLFHLACLPEYNTELGQCIEAMEVNVAGHGYTIKSRLPLTPETPDVVAALVKSERADLENFLDGCCYSDGISFVTMKRRVRRDLEATGNAYVEAVANSLGEYDGLNHLPSYTMRIAKQDTSSTPYTIKRVVREEGSWAIKEQAARKRFRRYIQRIGLSEVWFKELGDPRVIDCRTGEPAPETLPEEYRANEVIHIRVYSSRTPYGVPRYSGALLSIYGSRAAEEINYVTFKNNNVPSLAFVCSNGQFTDKTVERITDFMKSVIQGSNNYSKALIVEAMSTGEPGDNGAAKISIEKLTSAQHTDAMFQEYQKNSEDRVRRAFRLPPIVVGRSADYNRATADVAMKLADEQVFDPERRADDEIWNLQVLPRMGYVYHYIESRSPNVTDDTDLIQIMNAAEKSGGMTPRLALSMVEDILGRSLQGAFPINNLDMDTPFSLQMAEAVKNQAKPNEVGQQITALKRLGVSIPAALEAAIVPTSDGDVELEPVVKGLLDLRDSLRSELERRTGERG